MRRKCRLLMADRNPEAERARIAAQEAYEARVKATSRRQGGVVECSFVGGHQQVPFCTALMESLPVGFGGHL